MAIKKCFQCNKFTYTPYHVTEITKEKVYTYDLCKKCGEHITEVGNKEQKVDLSHIKTPEELLDFMAEGLKSLMSKEEPKPPCPGCGLTIEEFDMKGRFGCSKCYEHFTERMEQLVFPYHKANQHVGKRLKKLPTTIDEKRKLLKLKMAKAIELEEYEKAAEIKIELDSLLDPPPSSVDQ